MPTIASTTTGQMPNISAAVSELPTITVVGEAPRRPIKKTRRPEYTAAHASVIAKQFVRWAIEHGLDREWTVDDVWFLAAENFAPSNDVDLPPRRQFLGALQKLPGIAVTYDRRLYTRAGRLKGKTTFYRLPQEIGNEVHAALIRERIAA